MSIRQICKNLRTKGFKETYRIHRVHKCEEGFVWVCDEPAVWKLAAGEAA